MGHIFQQHVSQTFGFTRISLSKNYLPESLLLQLPQQGDCCKACGGPGQFDVFDTEHLPISEYIANISNISNIANISNISIYY